MLCLNMQMRHYLIKYALICNILEQVLKFLFRFVEILLLKVFTEGIYYYSIN